MGRCSEDTVVSPGKGRRVNTPKEPMSSRPPSRAGSRPGSRAASPTNLGRASVLRQREIQLRKILDDVLIRNLRGKQYETGMVQSYITSIARDMIGRLQVRHPLSRIPFVSANTLTPTAFAGEHLARPQVQRFDGHPEEGRGRHAAAVGTQHECVRQPPDRRARVGVVREPLPHLRLHGAHGGGGGRDHRGTNHGQVYTSHVDQLGARRVYRLFTLHTRLLPTPAPHALVLPASLSETLGLSQKSPANGSANGSSKMQVTSCSCVHVCATPRVPPACPSRPLT